MKPRCADTNRETDDEEDDLTATGEAQMAGDQNI